MSTPGDTSASGPGPWRVRFGGQTYRVKDEPSLQRLVDTGRVPPDAEVQPPDSDDWLSLSVALGGDQGPDPDPWSVWESIEEDSDVVAPARPPDRRPALDRPPVVRPQQPGASAAHRPPPASPPRVEPPTAKAAPPTAKAPPPAAGGFGVRVHPADDTIDDEDAEELATVDNSAAPIALGDAPDDDVVPSRVRPPPRTDAPAAPAPATPRSVSAAGRRGTVIQFPGPRPGRRETEGPHALAPETVPFPQPDLGRSLEPLGPGATSPLGAPSGRGSSRRRRSKAAKDDPPRTNWWRVGGIVVGGLLLLGVTRFYISMNSTAEFRAPVSMPGVPPGAESLMERAAAADAQPSVSADPDVLPTPSLEDPYRSIEQELRGQLMNGLQPTDTVEQLETALFIELNNVGLRVRKVDLNVLANAEGTEIPEVVEVRLRLRDDDSGIDRQIGAASLVLGKYAQHLELGVPLLEVGFEGIAEGKVLKRRVDIEDARRLYLGRLRLGDFLDGLQR